jgi:hypothetical protein
MIEIEDGSGMAHNPGSPVTGNEQNERKHGLYPACAAR